ncbi:hypothetical protein BY458DRAFT_488036 [Sporodiniella umbellata]|nr:hypothetical protein BY458DRAFT_488036 [Sporodiniella umbellata]
MILRAVDSMPRSFHNSEPNPLECLLLPLPAILGSRKIGPFKLSTKLRNAQVSELFRYHPDGHFLSRKPLTDVSTPLRIVANKLFRAMDRNHVAIQDFFYNCFFQTASSLSNPDHCTHIRTQQLGFLSFKKTLKLAGPVDLDDPVWKVKEFRKAYSQTPPVSKVKPPQWLPFWKLALTYIQRNTIFRLIHKRIPHMQFMHSVFPTKYITELCPKCLIEPDSSEHLFFNCHLCVTYWEAFIQEFLWPTPLTTIQMSAKSLTFSKIKVNSTYSQDIDSQTLTIIALSEIWKAHWKAARSASPFFPKTVLGHTKTAVLKRIAEESFMGST